MKKKLKFEIGDRVKFTLRSWFFPNKSQQMVGTITSIRDYKFGDEVMFGNQNGEKIFTIESNIYNTIYNIPESDIIESLNIYQTAYCKFKNNNLPYVFANDIGDLKIGDTVVVDTKYGYEIATVSKLTNDGDKKATKMIVCKVNTESFEKKRNKIESLKMQEIIREEQKKEIFDKMEKIYTKNCNLSQFKKMAQTNKQMAKLLKEYEDIENWRY